MPVGTVWRSIHTDLQPILEGIDSDGADGIAAAGIRQFSLALPFRSDGQLHLLVFS